MHSKSHVFALWSSCLLREGSFLILARPDLLTYVIDPFRFLNRRVKARGTDVEKRLLEALSGENWGAASTVLNQLAQDTYD